MDQCINQGKLRKNGSKKLVSNSSSLAKQRFISITDCKGPVLRVAQRLQLTEALLSAAPPSRRTHSILGLCVREREHAKSLTGFLCFDTLARTSHVAVTNCKESWKQTLLRIQEGRRTGFQQTLVRSAMVRHRAHVLHMVYLTFTFYLISSFFANEKKQLGEVV